MKKWERVHGADLDGSRKAKTEKNSNLLKSDYFINLCKHAEVEPTKRQASKYNNKKGSAYKLGKYEKIKT